MKIQPVVLALMSLFFAGSLLGQADTPDAGPPQGKAAKHSTQSNKPVDPKVAAIVKEIESRMIKVDGGTFTMGCVNLQDSECYNWEKPRHIVTISTFLHG